MIKKIQKQTQVMKIPNFVDVEALAKIIKANELDDEVRAILAQKCKGGIMLLKEVFIQKNTQLETV